MFENIYKNKKVIVTGHTGFKGSWLTLWLHNLGAHVTGISNNIPTEPSLFELLKLKESITDIREDIRNIDNIIKIIDNTQPDFLFHLAAQPIVSKSYNDPIETITSNTIGTINILHALKGLKNKCTGVIITSDKCYENVEWVWGYKETDKLGGKDIYSGSKAAAEILFNSYFHSFIKHQKKLRITTARAGNVIGGGDWALNRIVPDCYKAWSQNNIVDIRNPYSTRPWQHVLEPLSGYLALGAALSKASELNGESFNFGPLASNSITVEKLLVDLYQKWKINNNEQAFSVQRDSLLHEAGLLKLNCDKALYHVKWTPSLTYQQLIDFTGQWYYTYYKRQEIDIKQFTLQQIKNYTEIAKKNNILWAIK